MDFTRFVKSLALVGSEVYSVPSKGFEIVTVNAMITNTLVELDKQIGASERGMNTNASSQIEKLLEILQDESIVDVLSIVHKTMLTFYQFYANSRL